MNFINTTTLEIIFYFLFSGYNNLDLAEYYPMEYNYSLYDDDVQQALAEGGEEMYEFFFNIPFKLRKLFERELVQETSYPHKYCLNINLRNSEGDEKAKLAAFLQNQVEHFKNGDIISSEYYSFKRHLLVMDKVLKAYRDEYDSDKFTINSEFTASINPVKDADIDFAKIRIIEILFYYNKEGLIKINGCKQTKSKLDPFVKPLSLDINITLTEEFINQNINEFQQEESVIYFPYSINSEELLNINIINELKPCEKNCLEYALAHNEETFNIIEYIDELYPEIEDESSKFKKIRKNGYDYFGRVNKALNRVFGTKDEKYIDILKEPESKRSKKPINTGRIKVNIPVKNK